jgi:endonuclease/exonuclease/phosphatase family metal-dependent hydrolase
MEGVRRLLPVLALLAAGCGGPLNFTDPDEPRYAGRPLVDPPPAADSLTVVSFNLRFGIEVDGMLRLFESHPVLKNADVLLLQEMDVPSTRKVAHALGMHYVYYPATINPQSQRPFGNAILARWPITDTRKLRLPHLGRMGKTQRIAVSGTIRPGGHALRLYSFHMATGMESTGRWKKDQARAIVHDADSTGAGMDVILGGDLNSERVARAFEGSGYRWVTQALPSTAGWLSLDHIFLKGIELTRPTARGVVTDNQGTSDHNPLWIVVRLDDRRAGGD